MTNTKKIVYLVGRFLGLLGILFVIYKVSQEFSIDSFFEKIYAFKYSLIYLVSINYVALILGIYAWHIMLLNYTKIPFSFTTSYYYFAKTEIAKYIPGNIFHFIGRQILATKLNITQKEMMKISLFLSLLLMVGTVISTTIFSILAGSLPKTISIILLALSVFSTLIVFKLYPSFPYIKKMGINFALVIGISLHGIMLGIIVMIQSDNFSSDIFFMVASIYIVSSLLGFITPGASGGLGVREGAFIAISTYLHIELASDVIIFSVLLVRLLNIFTDILAYLSTFLIINKIRK